MITHDRATDLVVERVDFELSEVDSAALAGHLEDCASCEHFALTVARDERILTTSITWELDEEDYDPAGFGRYGRVRDDDDDAPEATPRPPRDRPEDDDDVRADDDDEEDDDQTSDSFTQDDDGQDEAHGSPPVSVGGHLSLEQVDEDDDEDEESDSQLAVSAEDDGDAKAAAQAEADSTSDEDLGGLDEDPTLDDASVPDCVTHGVEDAARAHGVPTYDGIHQRAEHWVRNEEGLEKTDYGNVSVYRTTRGLDKHPNYVRPEASSAAAAAIRNAVMRSRTGHTSVDRFQSRGRLDSKSLHRIAAHDSRLFKRMTAPSPGKFLVWVMVDVSGSMNGKPVADAAAVARALADAGVGMPTVRLAIWAWTTGFLPGSWGAAVAKVWETGMPTSEVFKLADLNKSGTPDAPVLEWAWRQVRDQCRSDERPVVIMCSDGWGDDEFPEVVARAVRHGVAVRSVALGDYVDEESQLELFGRGNYVPWQGDIESTARPLANMVARLASGQ